MLLVLRSSTVGVRLQHAGVVGRQQNACYIYKAKCLAWFTWDTAFKFIVNKFIVCLGNSESGSRIKGLLGTSNPYVQIKSAKPEAMDESYVEVQN